MKKIILLALTVLVSGFCHAQFSYTQITNGLTDVYEGGSMQFAIGDIDNDGDLDIVSVGDHSSPLIPAENGIMVFKNNGNGTSWTKTMNGNFGYGGVALGDVNNDGFMDVAYGIHHNYASDDFGDQVLEVVLGNGSGNSWVPYDNNLGQQGQSWGMSGCDFGDVDNDGLLDLGANSFGCCDGVWIYRNNGDGSWDTLGGALDLNSSGQFRFGDFNKDGKADFVANNTQFNNQPYQVWMNLGNAQFSPMQSGIPFSDDYFMFDIDDVNEDGAPDLALAYYGIPYVYSYNSINNTWNNISSGLPAANQNLWTLALGDMDGDGFSDLVTIKSYLITIYKGDGAGNWTQAATLNIPETICRDLKLADFDHNGMADIAYWAEYGGSSMLRVYLNNSIATELSIKPVSPNGGEKYCHGSAQFIRWNSVVPNGNPPSTVTLELSTSGISGPFTTIAANLPNNGKYQWIVPGLQSNNCFIKYTVQSGTNINSVTGSLPFTIDTCGNTFIIPGPISGSSSVCKGSTQTYSIPTVPNSTSYSWTLPSGWSGSSSTESITALSGNQGGTITVVANTAGGSSAPLSLYVAVVQIDTSVSQNGLTLTALESPPATYQWRDCLNNININGANAQSFTPGQNGSYSVIIHKENCTDTSSCFEVIVSGIYNTASVPHIVISPNPTNGLVKISSDKVIDKVEIFNILGSRLFVSEIKAQQEVLNLTDLPEGHYFLRIESDYITTFRRLIKIKSL